MKELILLSVVFIFSGCATFLEGPKSVIGISTRDVEGVRKNAATEDFQGDFTGIYDAVLAIAKEKNFFVFSQDEVRGVIVLMNIPGYVNTTEVGIFISPLKSGEFRVEISSRSSPVKEDVSAVIFGKLEEKFKKI
jgi:hypothetical protein